MNDCDGEMDHGWEATVCLATAHGHALELFEFAEEILDKVPPLVHLAVDLARIGAAGMLADDDLDAAFIEISGNGVWLKGLAGERSPELHIFDRRILHSRLRLIRTTVGYS